MLIPGASYSHQMLWQSLAQNGIDPVPGYGAMATLFDGPVWSLPVQGESISECQLLLEGKPLESSLAFVTCFGASQTFGWTLQSHQVT